MKCKPIKGLGLVLIISLMISNFVPLAAQAAVEGVNIKYNDERFPNPALTNATANTTVTVTGSLAENTNSIDFTGVNNTLSVKFSNLPEYYQNRLLYTYTITLENGYMIDIISGLTDDYLADIYCYTPTSENPIWGYSIYDANCIPNCKKLQNEVIFDIATRCLNPLLQHIPIIDNLKNAGVDTDSYYVFLNTNSDKTNTILTNCNFENFFNPMQYKIVSSELWVGILYDCTEDGAALTNSIYVSSPNASVETAPTVNTVTDIEKYALIFNRNYYAEANTDLKATFGTDEAALFNHFISSGMAEGRQGSEEFNVHAYRANNPDLVAVFGDDLASYYQHYMNSGKAEGRVAR